MSSTALPTAGRPGSSQVTEPAVRGQRSSVLVASGVRGPVQMRRTRTPQMTLPLSRHMIRPRRCLRFPQGRSTGRLVVLMGADRGRRVGTRKNLTRYRGERNISSHISVGISIEEGARDSPRTPLVVLRVVPGRSLGAPRGNWGRATSRTHHFRNWGGLLGGPTSLPSGLHWPTSGTIAPTSPSAPPQYLLCHSQACHIDPKSLIRMRMKPDGISGGVVQTVYRCLPV